MLSNSWVSINGKSRWDSHILSTIVLLQPETDLKYLSEKINNLTADKVKLFPGHQEWKFGFQPITEVHFDKYSWGDFNPGVNKEVLHILQLVALFIIIIALLNHVNISTNLLRGGPSFTFPGGVEMNLNLSTDQSKKVSFNAGNYHGFGDEKSSRNHAYWVGFNIRPMNALSISFSPEYISVNSELQYVATEQLTKEPRYIFAGLDQKTASFTFRLNYTFTPDLSLEYYGQPFVSAGKYTNFKRTTNTNADKFSDRYRIFPGGEISQNATGDTYSIDENIDGNPDYSFSSPDFNFRQFRSNLVVRWEYSPGSTLFLVWSQGRTGSSSNGSFDYGNDMKELFGIQPHNVFLIKFSYWFSL